MFIEQGDAPNFASVSTAQELEQAIKSAAITVQSAEKHIESCVICSEKVELNIQLIRRCHCESSPCSGHACTCNTNGAALVHCCCATCLVQHLFASSNSSMKKLGRFRAKCPTCKAEYCSHDFVLVQQPAAPAKNSATRKKSYPCSSRDASCKSSSKKPS